MHSYSNTIRPADTLQWPQADTQVVAPQAPGTASLYLISASGPEEVVRGHGGVGRTLQYSSRGMSTVGEQKRRHPEALRPRGSPRTLEHVRLGRLSIRDPIPTLPGMDNTTAAHLPHGASP